LTPDAAGPVLVYAPDRGIGDLMWHLPTIRAIAAQIPEGQVVLAARPSSRAAEVLAVEPTVSRVVYAPHHSGLLRDLREIADFWRLCRQIRPRAVWILEKIGRPALAAALAGTPERRGFGLGHASQERWLTVGPVLPRSLRPAHRLEKLAQFERLHGLAVTSREPALKLDPAAVAKVAARFAAVPRPWLVLGIGASEPARTWPIERFATLSRAVGDLFGAVFWLGGPADAAPAEAAVAALNAQGGEAGGAPLNVAACDLSLDAAAALIALSAGFVGNESGPLNLAAAVGRPAIGLMGTSPVPAYSRHLTALDGGAGRIADITVDEVVGALRRRVAAEGWRDGAPEA
jgi:heptosyltransferase-2